MSDDVALVPSGRTLFIAASAAVFPSSASITVADQGSILSA
jgi:hypothetical protein